MNEELRRDLDLFVQENESAIFRDIARLVAVNSVEGEAAPGAPFGPGPKAALDLGLDILLDIEPVGAMQVREKRPDAVLIFLAAPSFEELERRLTGRGDTAPDKIASRLEKARWEYTQAPQYDYIVVSDQVEKTADRILSIITAESCRARRQLDLLKEE